MEDLNSRFAPYGFFFELKGSDFMINATEADWTRDTDRYGVAKTLRKGNYDTMNIYTHRDMESNMIGVRTSAVSPLLPAFCCYSRALFSDSIDGYVGGYEDA